MSLFDSDTPSKVMVCLIISCYLLLIVPHLVLCWLNSQKKQYLSCILDRAIMHDVSNDNRVLSLVAQSGIRNTLVTLLDQLQRCQKSLSEFLEV